MIKKPFIIVIDSLNYLIKKVTFNQLDVKASVLGLILRVQKYYLVIIKDKTNGLIYVSKKKIVNFFAYYQNKEDYNEFKIYKESLTRKIDENSKSSSNYFKKFRFFQVLSLLMTNKLSLMNRYVNSSYFRKFYYEWRYKSEENIKDFNKSPFSYFSFKLRNFFSIKTLFSGSIKYRLKMLFMKIAALYTIYFASKLAYHRFVSKNIDKRYKETLQLFNELKAQNDIILKNNQIILEENIRLRNRKNN